MPRTELRSEVEIKAPLSRVYATLTDFKSYPEWNPFLTQVSGKLAVVNTDRGEITIQRPSLPPALLKYRIDRIRSFRDAEFSLYRRDPAHYAGKFHRPEFHKARVHEERREDMREEHHKEHREGFHERR